MIGMPVRDDCAIYRRIFLLQGLLQRFYPDGLAVSGVDEDSFWALAYDVSVSALEGELSMSARKVTK